MLFRKRNEEILSIVSIKGKKYIVSAHTTYIFTISTGVLMSRPDAAKRRIEAEFLLGEKRAEGSFESFWIFGVFILFYILY